jgi:hypothetical protein
MSSDKANVNDFILVSNSYHQAVFVTFDVKDNSVVGHKAGVTVDALDVCRSVPIRLFGICILSL